MMTPDGEAKQTRPDGIAAAPTAAADHAAPAMQRASAPSDATADRDDVMNVLEEFQLGLESLKSVYRERQELLKAFEQRTADLAEKEAELQEKAREVAAARVTAQRQHEEIQRRAAEIEQTREQVAAQRAELDAIAQQAASTRAELDRRQAAIAEAGADIERRAGELKALETASTTAAAELRAERQQLEESRTRAAADADAARSLANRLNEHEAQIRRQAEELSARAAEIEERAKAHAAEVEQLRRDRELLAAERRDCDAAQQAVNDERVALAAHSQKLRLDAEHGRAQDAEQAGRFEQVMLEYEALWLSELREHTSSRARALDAAEKAARNAAMQTADLKARLDEANKEIARAREKAEKAIAERDATAIEAQAAMARAERVATTPVGGDTEAAIAERLRKAGEALLELRDERDALDAQVRSLVKERDQLATLLRAATEQRDASASEREELRKQFALAMSEADALKAQTEQLRSKLRTQGASPSNDSPVRRERLRRLRVLLKDRSEKIHFANEALATRYKQCEQVLAQRAELAQAKELVRAAAAKYEKRRASDRTVKLIFWIALVVGALGVMSWFGVQGVVPGEYAAKTTIAADGRGRELNAGELTDWQQFHESMVTDPQFIELAAERMQRRGIAMLGTAPELGELVKSSMTTYSAKDGELSIELRGRGAERTARILETYVTALASAANAARERRADSAVTVIRDPAVAGAERLDDGGLMLVAAVWAGLILVFGTCAVFFYTRLARAKASLEFESHVDAVIDPRRWDLPRRT